MPLFKHTGISRTADRALEEFSDACKSAFAIEDPELWAVQLGLVLQTSALKTTFPIPIDAAGYRPFKDDMVYRSLYARAATCVGKEWQDGVEEKASVIEAPDFIGWSDAPGNMSREWKRLANVIVAALLEANGFIDLYRDPDTNIASSRALFAADHPFNILRPEVGTYDNDRDTTVAKILSGQFFEDAATYYRSIKGPNGKPMGLRLRGGHILVPGEREELFDKALKQDTVIRAILNDGQVVPPGTPGTVVAAVSQGNRFMGAIGYGVADELTQGSVFYTFANGNPGAHPFAVQQESAPEELVLDKSSEKYVTTGKVSIGYRGNANGSALVPVKICRWTITA